MRRPAAGSILDSETGARFARQWHESNDNVERLRKQREAEFTAREPAWSASVDIDHLRCPLHLQRMREALGRIHRGQILRISAPTQALIDDLDAAARQLHLQSSRLMFRGKRFLYIRAA